MTTEANRKFEEQTQDAILRRKYGISLGDFDEMVRDQNNQCLICGHYFTKLRVACVDHDHESGDVRGLLCKRCNAGLGMFQDSVRLLAAAIVYLDRHHAR